MESGNELEAAVVPDDLKSLLGDDGVSDATFSFP